MLCDLTLVSTLSGLWLPHVSLSSSDNGPLLRGTPGAFNDEDHVKFSAIVNVTLSPPCALAQSTFLGQIPSLPEVSSSDGYSLNITEPCIEPWL